MKIVSIVGSTRKESYNLKLAKYIQAHYNDQFDLEIVTLEELPIYNQDLENNPPAIVQSIKQKVKDADAVLWVTPEYNYSIPGVLKNAIDWFSRVDKVLVGKPSWIMGASMGVLGTIRAQQHLRDILFSPGVSSPLLPGNEVYVGAAHEKFDLDGNLTHQPTVEFLNTVVNNFISWFHKQR